MCPSKPHAGALCWLLRSLLPANTPRPLSVRLLSHPFCPNLYLWPALLNAILEDIPGSSEIQTHVPKDGTLNPVPYTTLNQYLCHSTLLAIPFQSPEIIAPNQNILKQIILIHYLNIVQKRTS